MKTLHTFTLRELAIREQKSYQNILNANKRGEFIAIAVRSGIGKNAKISYRYLSRRMSEILLTLASDGFFDSVLENDESFARLALERKKNQKISSHPKQYGTLSE